VDEQLRERHEELHQENFGIGKPCNKLLLTSRGDPLDVTQQQARSAVT
jgi:hypothetical protein